MADPEAFLGDRRGRTVILDEIHRLSEPAELLKIAADHYPTVRILATGSSTIGATARFRDTLAGRKTEVWLTPMTSADLEPFASAAGLPAGSGAGALKRRLLHGGLPELFLATELPERAYQEWTDAYWAKDILEHFRWSADEFDPAGAKIFSVAYPGAATLVVSADVSPGRAYERSFGAPRARFVALEDLPGELRSFQSTFSHPLSQPRS